MRVPSAPTSRSCALCCEFAEAKRMTSAAAADLSIRPVFRAQGQLLRRPFGRYPFWQIHAGVGPPFLWHHHQHLSALSVRSSALRARFWPPATLAGRPCRRPRQRLLLFAASGVAGVFAARQQLLPVAQPEHAAPRLASAKNCDRLIVRACAAAGCRPGSTPPRPGYHPPSAP